MPIHIWKSHITLIWFFEDNDFTVGIWVKRLALNNNWNHTVAAGKWHSGQDPSQNEWYLAISNGGSGNHPPQFAIQAGSTKYTAGGTAVPVGDWYHLVGVREGENIKLYVDGVLVDTEYVGAAVVNTIPSRNIFLGLMSNGKFLKAGFDEFVVYHRALDATEISELYGMGCGDFEGDEGVLASGGYRYGFNGKEKDDEVSGKGNQYDYGFRVYNSRLGKFLSKDPLFKNYAMLTPYQFASNTPVQAIDLDGLEAIQVTGWMEKGTVFRTQTFHDNFTSDLRVHYILHDVGTGTSTELWVNPIEIKYEPSAGERLLTGIRDAGNYVSDRFTSFDRMMKDKAKGLPTYEGVDGMIQMGESLQNVGDGMVGLGIITSETGVGALLIPIGGIISATGSVYQGIGQTSKGDYVGAGVTAASELIPIGLGSVARNAVGREGKKLIKDGVDPNFVNRIENIIDRRIEGTEVIIGRTIEKAASNNKQE